MINLAEGIEERAIERTTKMVTKEVTENIAINMYELGYTLEQIAESTNLDVNDIKTIIDAKAHKD